MTRADDDHALIERLRADGWHPAPWSNGPGDEYRAHRHDFDKVLVVSRGSIQFGLPDDGAFIELGVGDRLELPAGTNHDALVGAAGVTCLEAHAPAGTLPALARRAADDW